MKIGFFLSNSGSGGSYNQTKGLLNKFFNFGSKINPFQKFLKKNNIDLIIFSNPSYYSLYCENIPFVVNIWNTEIKMHNNFEEFLSGGYSFQKKIIDHAVDKSFNIFVFTEMNKQDLIRYFNCHESKITIQNLTPSLTKNYEANKFFDYKNVFKKFNFDEDKSWFFYPAQFWSHKNHMYLLEVLKLLKEKKNEKIGFIFCGPDKGNLEFIKEKIQEYKIQDLVKILGFIKETELISLYKYSDGIVMPTYLGRSSLPLLEALYFKKKIFYSKNTLDKSLSKYVEEFNLDDYKDLSNKLIEFIEKKQNNDLSNTYESLNLDSSFLNNYKKVIEEFSLIQKKWKNI